METVSMSGSLRENVGKKDAKKQRKEGNVPCVLYGGKEQVHFTMDERNFTKILFTPNVFIINLDLDGKPFQTVLQDIQYHPVTDKVLHADFLELAESKPVRIAIPVRLTGSASGIIKGGRLVHKMRKINIKALIDNLPDEVVIDISKLEIGDTIKIKDLTLGKVEMLDLPSEMVVGVRTTRVVVEEEEEEEEEEGEEGAPAAEGVAPAEGEAKPEEGGEARKKE
ncbi:MAG: 50S ribosomal protein L25/general stress protein Ctc [Bacteroidota bacterium]|nr:50S ribosomal protein L25/general stress protein Ctc [Bacteroidota bacterium]